MPWYGWAIVGLIVASSLLNVAQIGKPRKPLEPGTAVFLLIGNGLIIWGILALGGVA